MKAFVVIVLILAVAFAGWWFLLRPGASGSGKVQFRTAKVDRGEVVEGVAASGTVQPVELIQVGTQISGVIQKLHADFNSKVKAGETVAELDSRRLQSQVAQDEASVAKAEADLESAKSARDQRAAETDRAKAALAQAKADAARARALAAQSKADVSRVDALLAQARAELARQRQLVEKRLTSASDLDAAVASVGSLAAQRESAEAAVLQGDAQVASADAGIAQAESQVTVAEATARQAVSQVAVSEAQVRQAKALLEGDRVNLGYATILSPVDGVVVSRNVDVGQTVAASLQAPTLFVIARDLTKVQVETSVPEADIGRIREPKEGDPDPPQRASFTVDAHPDQTFEGTVKQVRLAATTVQNVVTYTVIVEASNPDRLLFPGMTANVTFEIARSPKDSLRVPATALRVQPPPELVVAEPLPAGAPPGAAPEGGRGRPPKRGGAVHGRPSVVYVPVGDGKLKAVYVRPGVSDGAFTAVEVRDPQSLPEGTEVVTAILRAEEPTATNPFAPPRFGSPRGR